MQSGLVEQGSAIQDALAKDPNAGRHEIQRQVCVLECISSTEIQITRFFGGNASEAGNSMV
jgi:hypothetical protein